MTRAKRERPGLVDDGLQRLTYQVIGLAMAVHNDLGLGHREQTYHNAMTQPFADAELPAEREPQLPIYDENGNIVNFYQPDHQVARWLLAEYKAHHYPLTNNEIAQCIDYFAASDCEVILVFNFGRPRLEWRHLFPPKHILAHRRKRWVRGSGDRL